MSFYRSVIAAVAAMTLASGVFAADEATTTQTEGTTAQHMQTTEANQAKFDINKATAKELMQIKGITSAKAKAIVSFRKKHGDFKTLDQLKEVKGFKKMNNETMKEIQEQLTVG